MRISLLFTYLLAATASLPTAIAQTSSSSATLKATLQWQALPDLPDALGVAGPFVGVHSDTLIVAGGANFPEPHWENDKSWHADAWVMTREADGSLQWRTGLALDHPVAYGAVATTSRGVVCMGGDDGQQVARAMFCHRLGRCPRDDRTTPPAATARAVRLRRRDSNRGGRLFGRRAARRRRSIRRATTFGDSIPQRLAPSGKSYRRAPALRGRLT